MVQVSSQLVRVERQPWFSNPANHLVHFYRHERVLVACLLEYVYTGLRRGETCVVMATPPVLISLQKGLRRRGIDVAAALETDRYITYDADEMLAKFMDGRNVDAERFTEYIGEIVAASTGEHPLRVYDEIVDRLMMDHNFMAAIEVERQWNHLLNEHPFSLYCSCHEELLNSKEGQSARHNAISDAHTSRLES